jgi:hypothetical protein
MKTLRRKKHITHQKHTKKIKGGSIRITLMLTYEQSHKDYANSEIEFLLSLGITFNIAGVAPTRRLYEHPHQRPNQCNMSILTAIFSLTREQLNASSIILARVMRERLQDIELFTFNLRPYGESAIRHADYWGKLFSIQFIIKSVIDANNVDAVVNLRDNLMAAGEHEYTSKYFSLLAKANLDRYRGIHQPALTEIHERIGTLHRRLESFLPRIAQTTIHRRVELYHECFDSFTRVSDDYNAHLTAARAFISLDGLRIVRELSDALNIQSIPMPPMVPIASQIANELEAEVPENALARTYPRDALLIDPAIVKASIISKIGGSLAYLLLTSTSLDITTQTELGAVGVLVDTLHAAVAPHLAVAPPAP